MRATDRPWSAPGLLTLSAGAAAAALWGASLGAAPDAGTLPGPDEERRAVVAPGAPQDLDATALSASEIGLTWSPPEPDSTAVAYYTVYRDGSQAGTSEDTAFTDTGRESSTTYTYRVAAVDTTGAEGEKSGEASATTGEDTDDTAPTAPPDLSAAAAGPHRIDLDWEAASDPESGIDHYNVYRDGSQVDSTPGTTYSDTALSASTAYSYRVSAVNGEGLEGEKSDEATATTGEDTDDTPPTAPPDLSAAAVDAHQIDLDWEAASDTESGIDHYNVYRDGSQVATIADTDYSDTGLSASTAYFYRVSAVNGEGLEGEKSGEASATTGEETDDTPPTAPSDLSAAAASPHRVDLDWEAASDPESGIDHYKIYRDGSQVDITTDTDYSDTDLSASTSYSYRISAVNGEGSEGEKSGEVSATTEKEADTVPPAPPGNLRKVGGG